MCWRRGGLRFVIENIKATKAFPFYEVEEDLVPGTTSYQAQCLVMALGKVSVPPVQSFTCLHFVLEARHPSSRGCFFRGREMQIFKAYPLLGTAGKQDDLFVQRTLNSLPQFGLC